MHHRLVALYRLFSAVCAHLHCSERLWACQQWCCFLQGQHASVHRPQVTRMEVWTRHAPNPPLQPMRIQGPTCGMDGVENVSTADILLLNSFASSRRLVSANSITITL